MRKSTTHNTTYSNALTKSITLSLLCLFCFKVALAPYCLTEDVKIVYEMSTEGEEEKKDNSESKEGESKKGSEEFVQHITIFAGLNEGVDPSYFSRIALFKDVINKLITPPPRNSFYLV